MAAAADAKARVEVEKEVEVEGEGGDDRSPNEKSLDLLLQQLLAARVTAGLVREAREEDTDARRERLPAREHIQRGVAEKEREAS